MKKVIAMSIFIGSLIFSMALLNACVTYETNEPRPDPPAGSQPYENNFQLVYQDSGICGHTSWYMCLKHLGDHDPNTCSFDSVDLCQDLTKVVPGTKVYNYIRSYCSWVFSPSECDAGATNDQLFDAADDLFRSSSKYYDVEQEKDNIGSGNDDVRRDRLYYVTNHFLVNNAGVIIHMRRDTSWGHYMVLIGFDPDAHKVYIADPWQPSGFNIFSVDEDTFIEERFYNYSGSEGPAYWDGEWVAFSHNN